VSDFLEQWRGHYGALPPLSFAIAKNDLWARFHALPASKRYPDNPVEEAIILARANTIADDVLSDDMCWLAQLGSIDGWSAEATHWRRVYNLQPAGEVLYDAFAWPVFASEVRFRAPEFDGILRDVALDRAFRTLWFNPVNGRVFAPYEGGFDVFLESPAAIAHLRAKHHAWLSTHPEGL
jgi:hypothetical protein